MVEAILQCLTIHGPADEAIQAEKEILQRLTIVDPTDEAIQTEKDPLLALASLGPNGSGEILQRPAINGSSDEAIQTEKDPLLALASLGPNGNGEVSPEPIPLRIVYRNDKHFSLSKSRRKDNITDAGWLPPCRPIKAVPFRDIWLIGKKELRWLWSHGIE